MGGVPTSVSVGLELRGRGVPLRFRQSLCVPSPPAEVVLPPSGGPVAQSDGWKMALRPFLRRHDGHSSCPGTWDPGCVLRERLALGGGGLAGVDGGYLVCDEVHQSPGSSEEDLAQPPHEMVHVHGSAVGRSDPCPPSFPCWAFLFWGMKANDP